MTQTLEVALDGHDARSFLCRGAAFLFRATTAAHVRFDVAAACSLLCMCQIGRPDIPSIITLEQPEGVPPGKPSERDLTGWWLRSAARVTCFNWFSQSHLAELPLSVEASSPSLLLLGREDAFTEEESDQLSRLRRHLLAVDLVMQRLDQARRASTPVAPTPEATGPGPLAGESLTPREREVLTLLSEGLLARSIARRLEVSERTVHKHLGNLYKKLDAHDRLLAVRRAEDLGLLPPPADRGDRRSRSAADSRAGW